MLRDLRVFMRIVLIGAYYQLHNIGMGSIGDDWCHATCRFLGWWASEWAPSQALIQQSLGCALRAWWYCAHGPPLACEQNSLGLGPQGPAAMLGWDGDGFW